MIELADSKTALLELRNNQEKNMGLKVNKRLPILGSTNEHNENEN